MSHHNTTEIQEQMIVRMAKMFREIIADEGANMNVDPEIADSLFFAGEQGLVSEYAFQHEGQRYGVELTEEQIDGIINEEETHLDYLDSVVYGILLDIEDGIVFDDDGFDGEDDEDEED